MNDGVEDADHNGMVDPGEADAAKHHGEVKILPTLPGDGDRFGVFSRHQWQLCHCGRNLER